MTNEERQQKLEAKMNQLLINRAAEKDKPKRDIIQADIERVSNKLKEVRYAIYINTTGIIPIDEYKHQLKKGSIKL